MRSAWIGPPTRVKRAALRPEKSRCKEISIPSALFAPQRSVREAARRVLDAFGTAPGHVFNLATASLRKHPSMAVSALVDEVTHLQPVSTVQNRASP